MDTSKSSTVYTRLQRIAELARSGPEMVFTTLGHLIDLEFLTEAWQHVGKDGAVGVDVRVLPRLRWAVARIWRPWLDRRGGMIS